MRQLFTSPFQTGTLLGEEPKIISKRNDLYVAKLMEELPLPNESFFTGNITDLTHNEEAEARDTFFREREKWLRFEGLWGELSFNCFDEGTEEKISLDCLVRIRLHKYNARDPKHYLFDMIMVDKDKKWSVVIDGRGAIIRCDDEKLASKIRPSFCGGGIMEILEDPYYVTAAMTHKVGYLPNAQYSREELFLREWQAYTNTEEKAKGKDKSYLFQVPYRSNNFFCFQEGRFSSSGWCLNDRDGCRYYYEDYQEIDGFEFPKTITAHMGTKKIMFKFGDIKIATSEKGRF